MKPTKNRIDPKRTVEQSQTDPRFDIRVVDSVRPIIFAAAVTPLLALGVIVLDGAGVLTLDQQTVSLLIKWTITPGVLLGAIANIIKSVRLGAGRDEGGN